MSEKIERKYINLKRVSCFYALYIALVVMAYAVVLILEKFSIKTDFAEKIVVCMYCYLPIASIFYGIYSYVKNKRLILPAIWLGVGYILVAIIVSVLGAILAKDVLSDDPSTASGLGLWILVIVDRYFMINILSIVGLSLASGGIVKLVISKKSLDDESKTF